jgi:hypothetical protein
VGSLHYKGERPNVGSSPVAEGDSGLKGLESPLAAGDDSWVPSLWMEFKNSGVLGRREPCKRRCCRAIGDDGAISVAAALRLDGCESVWF